MANWFITGVSTGFGRALAESVLAKGHKVIGTVRQEAARAPFEALAPGKAFAVVLDVTDEAGVHHVIDEVAAQHGTIDVLVNNAGYGLEGAIEEVSLDQVRRQFEVNVFGAVAVIQAVLPHMRKQRSGHIVNITSMGGLTAFPGVGIYNGSKFALDGISEALAKEVKPLGIKVTDRRPGIVPHRLGRPFHGTRRGADRGLRADGRRFPPIAGAAQRQAGRRPAQGGRRRSFSPPRRTQPPLHLLLGPDALAFRRREAGRAAGRDAEMGARLGPTSTTTSPEALDRTVAGPSEAGLDAAWIRQQVPG